MGQDTFFALKRTLWARAAVLLRPALLLLLLPVFLCACGEDPPKPSDNLPPPTPAESPERISWGYMPHGVDVLIVARDDINIVGEVNHAVLLKLVQVNAQEGIKALAATKEGIVQLLESTPENAGILLTKQLYIQPGSQTELIIDRAEGARYFAVIAGFDSLDPQKCFSITPFPIHHDTEREWLILSKDVYSPGLMDARIFLTEQQVIIKGFERVQE